MKLNENEICRSFRLAKSKRTQLVILSELNLCSKDDILRVLATNGENICGIGGTKNKNVDKILEILDEVDAEIQEAERKYLNIINCLKQYAKGEQHGKDQNMESGRA